MAYLTIGKFSERTRLSPKALRIYEELDLVVPAHGDIGWPAMVPAFDALERWTNEHQRRPAGPLRQLLIADQRTATPDTLVCDLTVLFR